MADTHAQSIGTLIAAIFIVTWTDLLIIYLACGSPFAVYRATRRTSLSQAHRWLGVFAALVFWPAAAFSALVYARRSIVESKRERLIDTVRSRLETILFESGSRSDVFEFREIFYRSTGLASALDEASDAPATHELFKITAHPSKELATRCLARKNQEKLGRHLAASQGELNQILSRLSTVENAENVNEVCGPLFRNKLAPVTPSIPDPIEEAITSTARSRTSISA